MILKIILSSSQFAKLAEYIASAANGIGLLSSENPGPKSFEFFGSCHSTQFASIAKCTPHKESNAVDATLFVAERFQSSSERTRRVVPMQYMINLISSMDLDSDDPLETMRIERLLHR